MTSKIALIGPMGSGKTTLGRKLARELGYSFCDLDEDLERATGVNIAWIFDAEGEDGFRAREARQLAQRLNEPGSCVFATGGGVVLRADNRSLLRQRCLVVYLRVSVAAQNARLGRSSNRPLLAYRPEQPGSAAEQRVRTLSKLQQEREPLYLDCAHHSVDSEAVDALQQLLRLSAERSG